MGAASLHASDGRSAPAQSIPARVADRYTLLEQLGAGGTATVHRARDEVSGQVVAFKQLLSSLAIKRRAMLEALFEREYQTLVRLKHPRIIEAYDFGLTPSGPYYTMELLDGGDLQQLSPVPAVQACRYLRDLASSLALIHAHRLLHRDVTPRNVRLTQDGRCKLIDFGALAGFGAARELVATPAYSAPEVMHRLALDQRSDLFALGAVGYFALTGRHAFGAQRLEVLEELWREPPLAPSKIAADIPPELDSLILSLLSIDPQVRPSSAAAVIDRLNAIAGLPPEDEWAAESYLSSGRMVGRAKELAWGRERVARALKGQGAAIVLEGSLGIGKTRLLDELALEAQLRGVLVLKADAQATVASFGLASALALRLLDVSPELARRQAQPSAGVLGHLGAELCERLEEPALVTLPTNPSERLALLQQALYDWFLAVAKSRPLLLAADNLHAADESSAAFLAALSGKAQELPLLLLGTLRSGGSTSAPAPLRALRKRSSRLKLSGLNLAGCEELVKSLFGEVDNTGRVARSLLEHSGGNPQHCMDLARLLVQRKIANYASGTWVLPLQLTHAQLPSRMEEFVAAKLDDLSPDARELVEALSIYSRPVSIERCLQSSERVQGPRALAALDELVAAQILLVESDRYRFAQDSVGTELLARLDTGRRRELHLRAAEALLSGDSDDLDLRLEAGWHLLHGGAERRGADMLAATSRAYLKAGRATESVDRIVTALVAAFEVYERQKRSDYESIELLVALVPLSYYGSDWRITTRYSMRAAELALRVTGLGLAQALRPWLGRKLAVLLGLGMARLRGARASKRGQPFNLPGLIVLFAAMQPTAVGTFCVCLDIEAAHQLARMFEALDLLPSSPFIELIHNWRKAMLFTLVGRERESMQAYDAVGQLLRDERIAGLVGEGRRKSMVGGSTYSRALLDAYCASPRALERAGEIEQLGNRFWAVNANQVRRLHHAYRGEIALAQRRHDQLELFATEGGSTWQSELFWPAALLDAYVLSADTIATRRTWEQLGRLAKDVPPLRPYADAAHAAYLTLRGELPRAIALYEQLLPALPVRYAMSWLPTRAYFAQALNLVGQHARAKQVLVDALSRTHPDDAVVAMHFSEARRQLALAEAGLGSRERAEAILHELFEMYGPLDNPLLLGLLHKARAEIALRARDRDRFELDLERMQHYFRSTDNPALIAQWERLNEQATLSAGFRQATSTVGVAQSIEPIANEELLAALDAASDRHAHALRLISQRARSSQGYLYLRRGGEVQRVAALGGDAAPAELENELIRSIERLAEEEDEDGATIVSVSERPSPESASQLSLSVANDNSELDSLEDLNSSPSSTVFIHSAKLRNEHEYHCVVLSTRRSGVRTVVGGFILALSRADLFRLDQGFRAVLADALCESRTPARP